MTNEKEGVVQAHQRGFGFAVTNEDERIFLPPPLMKRLVPGDKVRVVALPGRNEGELEAREGWLLSRCARTMLGVATLDKSGTPVLDADEPCFLTLKLEAGVERNPTDVWLVSVPPYEESQPTPIHKLPVAVAVTAVDNLGVRTSEGFDLRYALAKFGFEAGFSAAALAQAQAYAVPGPEVLSQDSGRVDLRGLPFVTIDSSTTQDFDDAIHVDREEGGWRLRVAIADVSAYVTLGSPLDEVARSRGTSVYLPGKTVPMLPKELSDGLCALKANQTRLAIVAELLISDEGLLKEKSVYRALIEVAANLTYDWVFEVMKKSETAPEDLWLGPVELQQHCDNLTVPTKYLDNLKCLIALYRQMMERTPTFATQLNEMPEPYFKDGNVLWSCRNDAHKLVEAYMLLANQEVAHLLAERSDGTLFRHQAKPTTEDWDELRVWVRSIGRELPEQPSKEVLDHFLSNLPVEQQFTAALRVRVVMTSAAYDNQKASHFSLGYAAYTHFSSPIRRYADLVVHRLLLGEKVPADELEAIALSCSERSRAARSAERFVWDKLKKRHLISVSIATPQLTAYVISQSKFGVRAVLLPWQCVVNVSGSALQAQGLKFDVDSELWGTDQLRLDLGSLITVAGLELEEYKARTDLQCKLLEARGTLPSMA